MFEREPEVDAARLRDIVANLSCPLCGGTRADSLLVVVDVPGAEAQPSVRAQCVRCHLFWAFAVDGEKGATAPVATRAPRDRSPISVDELIELHGVLARADLSLVEMIHGRAS